METLKLWPEGLRASGGDIQHPAFVRIMRAKAGASGSSRKENYPRGRGRGLVQLKKEHRATSNIDQNEQNKEELLMKPL